VTLHFRSFGAALHLELYCSVKYIEGASLHRRPSCRDDSEFASLAHRVDAPTASVEARLRLAVVFAVMAGSIICVLSIKHKHEPVGVDRERFLQSDGFERIYVLGRS
jgi:hypothetical protein